MPTMSCHLSADIWLTIFSMFTSPHDLYLARAICRASKAACEEILTERLQQLTGCNDSDEDGNSSDEHTKFDFQYILKNYSLLLKLPFTSIPDEKQTRGSDNEPCYFHIDGDESGKATLSCSKNHGQHFSVRTYLNWAPLDYEPTLETAKRIVVVRIIRSEELMSITVFKRGRLEKGLDIFKHWTILKEVQLYVPVVSPEDTSCPKIDPISCGLHTFQFATEPDLESWYYIVADVELKKILFIEGLYLQIPPSLYEQHGFLQWSGDDDEYALGNPSLIPGFEHITGYWLVSYWQYVIENSLLWACHEYSSFILPLNTGQSCLLGRININDDGDSYRYDVAIVKFHNMPGLTFNDYYKNPVPSSSSTSAFASYSACDNYVNSDSHSGAIVHLKIPFWDTIHKLDFSILGHGLPKQLSTSCAYCSSFFFHADSYVFYRCYNDRCQGNHYIAVDLSESKLQLILSDNPRYTVYNLKRPEDSGLYMDDGCIQLYAKPSSRPRHYTKFIYVKKE